MIKCPCEKCITLAVCRLKQYHGRTGILSICDKICNYLYVEIKKNTHLHKKRIRMLCKIMKPVHWELGEELTGGIGYNIIKKG